MKNVSRTLFGLWLVLVEICLILTGTENLSWDETPGNKTMAELGTNITIYWKYRLERDETFYISYLYYVIGPSQNKILASRQSKQGEYTNRKHITNMIVSGYSNVSLTIVNVDKSMEHKYCVSVDVEPSIIADCTTLNVYVTFNMTGKELSGNYCCVATNEYGNDTACTLVNLGVQPFLMNTTAIHHRMSNSSVTIVCQATGIPTPTIMWTANGSSDIIQQSKDGNLTVDFEPCRNTTLIYHCAASNIMGTTKWKSVAVEVDTLLYCNKTSIDIFTSDHQPVPPNTIGLKLAGVFVAVVVVAVVGVGVLFLSMKKKRTKKPSNGEDCYRTEMKILPDHSKQNNKAQTCLSACEPTRKRTRGVTKSKESKCIHLPKKRKIKDSPSFIKHARKANPPTVSVEFSMKLIEVEHSTNKCEI